jgi:hypothetical protein
MINVTATQKAMLLVFLSKLVFNGKVAIENELQYQVALGLVRKGSAKVSKRKLLGGIAEIADAAKQVLSA